MVLKLHYFNITGRAEAIRMLFTLGNVPFEDETIEPSRWAEYKPKTPFGQVPVLELDDGRQLAETGAIERYVAKLAGLYPKDDVVAAFADQWWFVVEDIAEMNISVIHLPTEDAKVASVHELLQGKLGDRLKQMDKHLSESTYLAGDELSFADIEGFSIVGMLMSVLPGVPKDVLDKYPALKKWFQRIARLDAIKARYADATGPRAVFRVDQPE